MRQVKFWRLSVRQVSELLLNKILITQRVRRYFRAASSLLYLWRLSFRRRTSLARAAVIDPGLNQETLNPGCSSASTPRSNRTQSRLRRFAFVSRPCVGGRPVDAPPWKRHLPPAPRPGFLHCTPDCRDLAAQRGRAASTARAL